MANRIALGVPTQYDFRLPQLRRDLSGPFLTPSLERLLDFGCGNGANTVLYAGDATAVVGIDVVPAHVEVARARAEEAGLDNITYMLYGGDRLPFDDASFDHAVSYEVLEHTADDRAALGELRRVMRPGSVLTMSVPNKWYLMETHGFDLPPASFKWNRVPLLSWLPTPIHERYAKARIYTRRRIVTLLEEAGFTVLYHQYVMPPFDIVHRPRAQRVLRRTFDRVERSPLRLIGVAHFIAARRR